MIHIKKDHEIEAMRLAGGVSSTVLREVAAYVKPGMSTLEIDQYGGERIRHYGGKSAFLGYRDYPCNICISVNEEVVHGLPSSGSKWSTRRWWSWLHQRGRPTTT